MVCSNKEIDLRSALISTLSTFTQMVHAVRVVKLIFSVNFTGDALQLSFKYNQSAADHTPQEKTWRSAFDLEMDTT